MFVGAAPADQVLPKSEVHEVAEMVPIMGDSSTPSKPPRNFQGPVDALLMVTPARMPDLMASGGVKSRVLYSLSRSAALTKIAMLLAPCLREIDWLVLVPAKVPLTKMKALPWSLGMASVAVPAEDAV